MCRWKFKYILALFFAVIVLVGMGCSESQPPTTEQSNSNQDDDNNPNPPPETTYINDGFIVVGNFLGDVLQTHYYDIHRDLLFRFGFRVSRDGVFSADRDSVYFNYGGVGEGIWAAYLDTSDCIEPVLIYDSPNEELNLCSTPLGIVFNSESSEGTFMLWTGATEVGPVASLGAGMVRAVRICPKDSTKIAAEFWGFERRVFVFAISDTAPWDTIRSFEGDLFAWFDIDSERIVAGNSEHLFIHHLYGERDSTEIPLPEANLVGVATDGLRVIGIFNAGGSTDIYVLEANYYIERKIASIEGNPITADISPFDHIMAVATSREGYDYVTLVDLDSGEANDVLVGNAITYVRWK